MVEANTKEKQVEHDEIDIDALFNRFKTQERDLKRLNDEIETRTGKLGLV